MALRNMLTVLQESKEDPKKFGIPGGHQWSNVLLSHLEGNFEMHINVFQHEINALHNLSLADCSCIF